MKSTTTLTTLTSVALCLCCFLAGFAKPADPVPDIAKAFETYKAKYPASRLHLIFNQPAYAPGDTIFFTAWHLNETSAPVQGRQIGSLDLVGEDGKAAVRIHFRLENGRAANQLIIDKELAPGNYTLVAYTDWMRNFGREWFFRKQVTINGRNVPALKVRQLGAFVEGGNLVAGLTSRIALIGGQPGTAVSIRNQQQEKIGEVTLDSTGVATVTIKPKTGDTYTVYGYGGEKISLPEIKASGLTLTMSDNQNVLALSGAGLRDELTAVFTSGGKIREMRNVTLREGEDTMLDIPFESLQGFYNQVFVLDADGNVLAGRVIAGKASLTASGSIQSPSSVHRRQNIDLTLDLSSSGKIITADLCVSAYQKKMFNTKALKQSFYLSELPDVLEWADTNPAFEHSLNNFLISQRWHRIDWKEIFSREPKRLLYPNSSQLMLRGLVRSRTNGQPAPDSTNVIVYLQKNTMGYDTYTRDGRFLIPVAFDFWGDDFLFYTLQRNSRDLDEGYEVVFDTDSTSWPPSVGVPVNRVSAYGTYAFNKKLVSDSYSFFGKITKKDTTDLRPNALFEDEIGEIDYEVNVEKYVVFPNMREFLREVVPFVQYRDKGVSQGVRMLFRLETTTKLSKSNPLYVIDGVMTRNSDFFLALKPKDVAIMKIVNNQNRLLRLGKMGENGIILVESKAGNLADTIRQQTNSPVTGLNRQLKFNQVEHKANDAPSRVPDLRSTLYWQSKVSTDSGGKLNMSFSASDDVEPVTILIQGLTSDGIPVFIEREVTIEFR